MTEPVASPQAPSHSMKPASLNWTIKHLHIVAGFFPPLLLRPGQSIPNQLLGVLMKTQPKRELC